MTRKTSTGRPIRIGIIGTGFGIREVLPATKLCSDAAVTHICGSDVEKTQKLGDSLDLICVKSYQELCECPDVDLVWIATPPHLHKDIARKAISSRKHVVCEKPLALDLNDALELTQLSDKTKGHIHLVNHQLRFHPQIASLRLSLHSGQIGRPFLARIYQESSDYLRDDDEWKWWFEEDLGGGLLLAMGPHLFDLAYFLFGQCVEVYATATRVPALKRDGMGHRKLQVESSFSSLLTMESELAVEISATAAASLPRKRLQISIFGTRGEVHYVDGVGVTLVTCGHQGTVAAANPVTSQETVFRQGLERFLPELFRALQSRYAAIPTATTFRGALESMRLIEAVRASIYEKRVIDIGYESFPKHHVTPLRQLEFVGEEFLKSIASPREHFDISPGKDIGGDYKSIGRAMVSLGPLSSKRFCPFDCQYCYVHAGFHSYPKLEPEEIVAQLAWRRHAEPFDIVYVSGDTDSFFPSRNGLGLLEALTTLNVDLLFTTKCVFESEELQRISDLVRIQRRSRRLVFGCVSICMRRIDRILEPLPIPTPDERIRALRALKEIGCVTFLAIRPFLPTTELTEYRNLINECAPFIDAVLGEPWYIDDTGELERRVLGSGRVIDDSQCKRKTMDFDRNPHVWKVWGEEIAGKIERFCDACSVPLFMRSYPAVQYVRNLLYEKN